MFGCGAGLCSGSSVFCRAAVSLSPPCRGAVTSSASRRELWPQGLVPALGLPVQRWLVQGAGEEAVHCLGQCTGH